MTIHKQNNRIPYKSASIGETDSIALELVGTGQTGQHRLHMEALERIMESEVTCNRREIIGYTKVTLHTFHCFTFNLSECVFCFFHR